MGLWDNLKKAITQNLTQSSAAPGMTQGQMNTASQAKAQPTAQNTPQANTPKVRPYTGATNKATKTTSASDTRTPAQKAVSSPTVLPTGTTVESAKTKAQKTQTSMAKTEPVEEKTAIPKSLESAVEKGKTAFRDKTRESMRDKSLPEIYSSLSSYTGVNAPKDKYGNQLRFPTDYVKKQGERLQNMYQTYVAPGYDKVMQAQEDYRKGKISYNEVRAIENQYMELYYQYQPSQDAWEKLSTSNNNDYWNNADLDEASSNLDLYMTALEEGGNRLTEMQKHFDELNATYEKHNSAYQKALKNLEDRSKALDVAEKAYKGGSMSEKKYKATLKNAQDAYDEYIKCRNDLNSSSLSLSEYQGQLLAAQMYYDDIAETARYGSETWRKRYLDANPSIAWGRGEGEVHGDIISIQEQLKEYMQGGGVDLLDRPEVDASELEEAGWQDVGEGTATVFTNTFSNHDFMSPEQKRRTATRVANFTPIAVDAEGNVTILSPEELEEYARGVLIDGNPDELGLQIGAAFTGADALSDAEKVARNIHTLHEIMINEGYTSDVVINDTDFLDILHDIRDLQDSNVDGKNDAEIAYYYKLLNDGQWEANLTQGDYDRATYELNAELAEAQQSVQDMYNRYRQKFEDETGRSISSIEELQLVEAEADKDPEMLRAKAQESEAQKWLNQLRSKKYEMTYENLIEKMPDYLAEQIEEYINIKHSSSHADTVIWETVVRDSLEREGYSEKDIEGFMWYIDREVNKLDDADVYKKWYDWSMSLAGITNEGLLASMATSSPVGDVPVVAQQAVKWASEQVESGEATPSEIAATLINWPVQMITSLGQIASATDLTAQGAGGLATQRVDPYTGEYVPIDYHTAWQAPYTVNKALNDAEYQRTFERLFAELGDQEQAAKKAQMHMTWYDLTQSMGQSTVIMGLSLLGVPGSMILLSGSAAAQTMHEMHDQGYSDGYVITAGLAAGFAEYITEKFSIEQLMKVGKAGLKSTAGLTRLITAGLNIGSQYLSEASEEGASDIVNLMADYFVLRFLNGGISQIEMDALALREQNSSLSWEEALNQSWLSWAKQTGTDAWYGGISGGLMGAGGFAIGTAVGNAQTTSAGADVRYANGLGVLQDYASAIDRVKGSEGQAAINAGTDSDFDIGLLRNRTRDAIAFEAINDRLYELGEKNASADLIRGINALANDDRLSAKQKRAVAQNKYARKVANELAEWYENQEIASVHPEVVEQEWVRDLAEAQATFDYQVTNSEYADNYNKTRANELEIRYRQAQENNPDASVMNPLGDAIGKAGATPEVAVRQGRIMAKILSGEELTPKELAEFDLNNKAVRDVFKERTGLTNMPNNVPPKLKKSYVNRVIADARIIVEQQEELGRSSQMLADMEKERSQARTEALKKAGKKKETALTRRLGKGKNLEKATGTRSENQQSRTAQGEAETQSRVKDAHRNDAIDIKGKTGEQVIQEVADRAGVPTESIPRWADFLADYNRVMADQKDEESTNIGNIKAQGDYLNTLMRDFGLKAVEAEAILTSQRGTEYTEKAEPNKSAYRPTTVSQAKNTLNEQTPEEKERLASERSKYADMLASLEVGDEFFVSGRETPVMRVTAATNRWAEIQVLNEEGEVIGNEWILPDTFTTGTMLYYLNQPGGYRIVDAKGNEKANVVKEAVENAGQGPEGTRVSGGGTGSGVSGRSGEVGNTENRGAGEESGLSDSVGRTSERVEENGDTGSAGLGETSRGNTYSVAEIGIPDSSLTTDTKNLHLLSSKEYVNDDGTPGKRADLYYGNRMLGMMGAARISFVYADEGIPGEPRRGIVIRRADNSVDLAGGLTDYGTSAVVVVINSNHLDDTFNPVRVSGHEGYHVADGPDRVLTNAILAVIDADPKLKAKLDADIADRAKVSTYEADDRVAYASEIFADAFAGRTEVKASVRYGIKGFSLRPYQNVVLGTVKQLVPGFDQTTYDLAMQQARRFAGKEYREAYKNYVLNEALYDGMEGTEAVETEAQDKENILKGQWANSLLNVSRFKPVTPAPVEQAEAKAETPAPVQEKTEEKPKTEQPRRRTVKRGPRTMAEKIPSDLRQLSREDYVKSELRDQGAEIVDLGNVRKLARTESELRGFNLMLRELDRMGMKYVFVNSKGSENSKRWPSQGSPTSRLVGAVSYITVQKGDTLQDVVTRLQQGLFDQINRVLSKGQSNSQLVVELCNALEKENGLDLTEITNLAERTYEHEAWRLGILYDCWREVTRVTSENLSEGGLEYAERTNTLIGADKDSDVRVIEKYYDKEKADKMYAKYREWAMYRFFRDVMSGVRNDMGAYQIVEDVIRNLKFESKLRPTWGFERRLDEENRKRAPAENVWRARNTFLENKKNTNPLTKRSKNDISTLLAEAEKRARSVSELTQREAVVSQQISDISSRIARIEEQMSNSSRDEDATASKYETPDIGMAVVSEEEFEGVVGAVEEDYTTDPRFIELLDRMCQEEGINRWEEMSSYDFGAQDAYARAWNKAVNAYNDQLLGSRRQYARAFAEGTTAEEGVRLAEEDSVVLSDLKQQLQTLRAQQRQAKLDLIGARAAAEGVRDTRLAKLSSLPYRTLAAQMFDDVLHGDMTAQEAFDKILSAYNQLQKNPDLTVEELAGHTLTTNYWTDKRSMSVPEYKEAERELREELKKQAEEKRKAEPQVMFDMADEDIVDYTQPTERELNASVIARGDAEKAEQIRQEEQEKRNQARRTADLKTVKDMKNEAGKTDSDKSEVTPTDVRNNLLDELDEAEADLRNAPVGYAKNIQRVASKSSKAEAYMRRHAKKAASLKKSQTVQEGSPMWGGTGNIGKAEQSRKDSILGKIKAAGNTWMYQTYSDCWGLEKFGMKQTRVDGVRNLINLVRGSNETTQYIYTNALVDRQGNYIGKSMKDTMICWDGKNVDTERQTKLQRYLLLMHTVDRMSVEERAIQAVIDYEELHPELRNISPGSLGRLIVENNNPIAKEYYRLLQWEDGAENKPVLAILNGESFSEMNAATAQALAGKMLADDPWLAQKAQEIYDWWDMFMREWGAGGRMSVENYENMRRAYPHYIPTYRAGDDRFVGSNTFRGSTEISTGPVVRAAKGSTLEILPFEDQFAMLASQYVQGARANELAWNFMQELLLSGEANNSDFSEFGQIDYDRTAEDFINERIEDDADPMSRMIEHDEAKHEYRVNCWVDGKQVSAYVSKEIYQSFQNLLKKQSEGYKKLMAAGNKLTSPMKEFITGANPSFALRNVFADIPTAMINSITNSYTGIKFMDYWFKAWDHIGRDSDQWQQFQALGGTHSNIVNPHRGFSTETSKKKNVAEKVRDFFEMPGEYSESVTRFAEYLATIDMLGDTFEGRMAGIHNAAEITVDFGRGGYSTRAMNAWSPYFNPAVQGIYKVVRGVVENKGWDRAKYLMRVGATTLPVEILMALIRGMAGREKDFEEESDYLKDNYYLIPMGGADGHKWFKIRKNREWAALFGNTLMRALEGKNGYDDPFGTYLPISIVGNFLPDAPVPIFAQWFIDAATNKNFAGSTIVPSTFDDFKEERPMDVYDEETTLLAYGIASIASKVIKSANPMFVDYILDYYCGDFWTNVYSWVDMGLAKEVVEEDGSKTLTIAENALELFPNMAKELQNDWITNSLYSNSTMTRYYDKVKKLRANTSAEKYQNAGKSTGSLDEQIYEALYYSDLGYASQITALAKEARSLPEGEEKDSIKKQQILLAHAAMEFINQCTNGEIVDPMRQVKYGMLDPKVTNELIRLSDFSEQFEFEPSFSRTSSLSDPDNKGYHFSLTDEQKDEYVNLWRKNYSDMTAEMMRTEEYKIAPDGVKAMMLAQKRTEVHSKTNADYVAQLKKQGEKSTKKTLEDVEILQIEAQYALARANDPSTAVSSKVSDELIRMREYGSEYSFVMATSVPKTFSTSSSSDYVYELNDRQKDYYARLRSSLYNEAMESIITSKEYKSKSEQDKAVMLQATAQAVSKQLKTDFGTWMSKQTDVSTKERKSMSEEAQELDAEYAVTRILTPNNAYSKEVTDELVRLYKYSESYSFQPSTYVPSHYADPNKKGYTYYLTPEQKKKYQEFSHNVYDAAFKQIMKDPSYKNAKSDADRAALLQSMRNGLSDEVRRQFLAWLAKNGKSQEKEDNSEEKALDKEVKKLLGWK